MLLFHSIGIPKIYTAKNKFVCLIYFNFFFFFKINFTSSAFRFLKCVLTWKIQTQIAMQRVPLWPSPSMSVENKSLEYCSNCDSPKRLKIQVQHMEWPMHGRVCVPILHINDLSIDTNDTVKSLWNRPTTKRIEEKTKRKEKLESFSFFRFKI